jgi:hypothetical protein
MQITRLAFTGCALGLLLGGCQPTPSATTPSDAGPSEAGPSNAGPVAETICPVIESSGWTAWIDRMPGPNDNPTLHVRGAVTVPQDGYRFEWREGPMDRMMPPGLRLTLEPKAPEIGAQVISEEEVAYSGPAFPQGYRVIYVLCAGEPLAEITEIDDVQ